MIMAGAVENMAQARVWYIFRRFCFAHTFDSGRKHVPNPRANDFLRRAGVQRAGFLQRHHTGLGEKVDDGGASFNVATVTGW